MNDSLLEAILLEGESSSVEFKENITSNLSKEFVAFANAQGGSVFVGVNDHGEVKGINITNRLRSQIYDIAQNCDPSITINLIPHEKHNILEIEIPEGIDKPYRCTEGFFLRNGPSAQKLKRDEIVQLIKGSQHIQFDNAINPIFQYPKDFSKQRLQEYLQQCGIDRRLATEDILLSLYVAKTDNKKLMFNNTGVLFFAKNPQQFFQESFITCVKYKTADRFSIIDKKDMLGSPIEQIEAAMAFLIAHIPAETSIIPGSQQRLGARVDIYDYPIVAMREAIVNAVTHRDYLYNASHIYIHMYPNWIDIENPGGLYPGLTLESLGKRSIRRNPLIADLLHRAKYIERVGSGIDRMQQALEQNNNPELQIVATNFFNIRFFARIKTTETLNLTPRQIEIYNIIREKHTITRKELTNILDVSEDTVVRALNALIDNGLIVKEGYGKITAYRLN